MQAMMKLYPLPNANPNTDGGYNWEDDICSSTRTVGSG